MATANNNRTYTSYPNGWDGGVLIQNLLGLDAVASQIFYVGNNPVLQLNERTASNGNKGTFYDPFSTIAYAISQCSANNNNVILVREGYTETVIAAGGITCNVAGVYIVGCGQGSNRPTLTFSTAVSASLLVSAANVTIKNILCVAGINALTNPINVQAAGCTLDVEWNDGSSSVEANRAILTNASADNLKINLKYVGFPAGSSAVNAVRLVGCNNGSVIVDAYGKFSTSVVEFLTTACTNIEIGGYFYNSGTTDLSKNVIDTVTGSTWFVSAMDGAAGLAFDGGSGKAIASEDISTIVSNQTIATVDGTANAFERDAIGNKTDAAVTTTGTTKSIMAYAKGALNNALVPSTDSTANIIERDVVGSKADTTAVAINSTTSIAAYAKGNLTQGLKLDAAALATSPTAGSLADFSERCVVRTTGVLPQSTSYNIFTVTGAPIEILEIIGEVTTVIQTQANNTKLKITDTASSTTTDICSVLDITAKAVGSFFNITGTLANALVNTPGGTAISQAGRVICPVGAIKLDCAASNTGAVRWYLRYRPLGTGSVVAAA